jgi:glycosyltransferase involved in cell wall biosynthesis
MLRMLAGRLELGNVSFERFLSGGQLSACYRSADLFVCTSRHEGYCLPLVEAMHHDVPVLARQAGGMPEALGGAGVSFDEASPKALAVLMHRLLTDAALRRDVLASQRERIKAIRARSVEADCLALVEGLDNG